jgi:hypothetical protein
MNTVRELNATIKRVYRKEAGFLPAKASWAGSIPAIRFEGDMPVSLVTRIAKFVEFHAPEFAFGLKIDANRHERSTRSIGFIADGVVINWI